jgi:glucose-1-phosphate thymidylyltransferase
MQRHQVKAVVLARGLGKRMRRADDSASLAGDQARMADSGIKAMIPIGRPFLDYVLSALADAGVTDVVLVIGPEHDVVREYYAKTCVPTRLRVSFAVQERPLGTADAVTAAAANVGGDDFLVLNSDNYYPPDAFRALVRLDGPGLVAFGRDAMIRESNVSADRIRAFAVVRIGPDDRLDDIFEKPDDATISALGDEVYVSLNCWRFDATVLDACRRVSPSPRGELEIPDGVRLAMTRMGSVFRVVRMNAGVLDLSSRGDVAEVAARLASVRISL